MTFKTRGSGRNWPDIRTAALCDIFARYVDNICSFDMQCPEAVLSMVTNIIIASMKSDRFYY